jgi:GntR family transcriptional regulator/MocR family aminotransferase
MMELSLLCRVASPTQERESGIVVFHVSLVGRTDLSGEIYRQIRQAILDGAFDLASACHPRENWPPR